MPQAREEYTPLLFIQSAGMVDIPEPSFLVSFPDPENCIALSNIIGTESMRPAFSGGHQAILNTCFEITDLRAGDIITFLYEDSLIIHQIIEIRPDGVVTKGINNEVLDGDFLDLDGGIVGWDNMIGVLVAIVY